MKWVWASLAGFVGILIGAFIQLWPVRPIWVRATEDEARIQQFSRDDGELITTHVPKTIDTPPYLCRWATETGKLLSRVPLHDLKRKTPYTFLYFLDDARTVAVGLVTQQLNLNKADEWYLYYSRTGERLVGPLRAVDGIFRTTSKDGRYYCVFSRDEANSQFDRIDLHEIKTGKLILQCKQDSNREPLDMSISPDGFSAIVFWKSIGANQSGKNKGKTEDESLYACIHALPSGRETKRFMLPEKLEDGRFRQWDGKLLDIYVRDKESLQTNEPRSFIYRVDTIASPVRYEPPEPLLQSYSDGETVMRLAQYTDQWCAYIGFEKHQENKLQQWMDWLHEKLNVPMKKAKGLWGTIKIRDRVTGQFRYQIPYPVMITAMITQDGRHLASSTEDGGVAMWELDPPPRWPWSLLASLVTAAPILLLGRWRTKRQQQTLAIQSAN